MLVVREVRTYNFLGHAERTLALADRGITLITGRNGVGKSTCIEAVAFGFWGHTLRGTTPWRDGVPGRVEVVTPDLTVRRGVSKSGSNALNFTREGKTIKGDSAAKCQKELELHVPDMDVWRWSSVLSSADAASFSLATDAQRKLLIENMLSMPSTDQALKETRTAIKALKAQIGELQTKAAVLRERLANERRRLVEASTLKGDGPAEDLDAIVAQGKAAAERAKVLQGEVEELRRKASDLAVRGATEQVNLSHLEARARACGRAECPTCGQHIPAELAAVAKAELDAAMEAKRKREMAIAVVAAERAEFDRAVRAKSAELDRATRERDTARVRYQAAQAARQQAVAAEGIKTKAEAAIAETEAAIAATERQVEDLQLELKHEEAVEEVLGARGARTHLLSSTLAAVSQVANGWLARLAGPHFRLSLRSYSETSRGEVTNKISMEVEGAGGGHGYKASSGGERKRIDIAVMLALGDIARRLRGEKGSTLFFDEAFDALDEQGLAAVVGVLRELAQDRAVVVISHNPLLIDHLRPHAKRVHLE